MCVFCENRKNLLELGFSLGITEPVKAKVFIEKSKRKEEVNSFLYMGTDDEEIGIKIDYCPICGRKLT